MHIRSLDIRSEGDLNDYKNGADSFSLKIF